jgi:hypothetical protein
MPLNRSFYSFAVFLSGLHSVIIFIHALIFFLIGRQIYSLSIFFPWYLFYSVISILMSLVFLNYFHLKKFTSAFWAGCVSISAGVFQLVTFFGAFMDAKAWMNIFMLAQLVSMGTTILFGLTLIFSNAGKRYWLKFTGIFFLLVGLVLMTATVWYLNSSAIDKLSTLDQYLRWASLISFLAPIMIMMNFLDEQKQLRPGHKDSVPSRTSEKLIAVIQPIAMLATLFFALKLASETATKISWERNLARQEKEWEKVWGARTFTRTNGDTLKYQLIPPQDLDSTETYPMVVCLPYGGGIEGSPAAKFLLTEINRKKYPAFLFVPFCPNGTGWGGIPNYPTMDTLVFESIEAVEKEFSGIDVKRVYVTGVSRGGYGSWHFISLRPDLFAAAMPVCGGGDPNLAPNMVDVAVWAFHGENDRNVPVSGSRDMIQGIRKSGGDPKYTEFSGAGHDIWHYVTTTPGVFDWLFEQKRK